MTSNTTANSEDVTVYTAPDIPIIGGMAVTRDGTIISRADGRRYTRADVAAAIRVLADISGFASAPALTAADRWGTASLAASGRDVDAPDTPTNPDATGPAAVAELLGCATDAYNTLGIADHIAAEGSPLAAAVEAIKHLYPANPGVTVTVSAAAI